MRSDTERSSLIRAKLARLEALDGERRNLLLELAPLEVEESLAMGYAMPLRGHRLLEAMDRRDRDSGAVDAPSDFQPQKLQRRM